MCCAIVDSPVSHYLTLFQISAVKIEASGSGMSVEARYTSSSTSSLTGSFSAQPSFFEAAYKSTKLTMMLAYYDVPKQVR